MEKRLNGCSTMSHCTHSIAHSASLHNSLIWSYKSSAGKIPNGKHTIQRQFWLLILKLAYFLEKRVMVHTYNLSYLGGWGYKTVSTASSKGFKAILGTQWDLVTRHQKPHSSFKSHPKRNSTIVLKQKCYLAMPKAILDYHSWEGVCYLHLKLHRRGFQSQKISSLRTAVVWRLNTRV